MASAAIPLGNNQASDGDELGGSSSVAMNVLIDQRGVVRRRPGLRAYSAAPDVTLNSAGIDGIHSTNDGKLLAVYSASGYLRKVVQVTSSGGLDLKPLGGTDLSGFGRPVFAETEAIVAIAAGQAIQKVVLATMESSHLGGSPPFATHVVANAERLLCNSITEFNRVFYSDLASGSSYAGHEEWNGVGTSGFFGSDARPDPNLAVAENTNDIFVFGSETVQVFGTDPTLIYATQAALEVGIGAPYSLVKDDQVFCWLDQNKRFVRSSGRGDYEVISDPIARTLQELEHPEDCFGYRLVVASHLCLVWTFPTDGVTFVLQKGAGWGQWSSWDDDTANWSPFPVRAHAVASGKNLVATTDGFIRELTMSATTDMGEAIQAYVVSGYQDRGSPNYKHCNGVSISLRRGTSPSPDAETPSAFLMWRDRPGPWEGEIPIELGDPGDTEPVVQFYSLGTYRRRQWGFRFTGTDDLQLVSVAEDFDVMEN